MQVNEAYGRLALILIHDHSDVFVPLPPPLCQHVLIVISNGLLHAEARGRVAAGTCSPTKAEAALARAYIRCERTILCSSIWAELNTAERLDRWVRSQFVNELDAVV
jgi:hypothetical protein